VKVAVQVRRLATIIDGVEKVLMRGDIFECTPEQLQKLGRSVRVCEYGFETGSGGTGGEAGVAGEGFIGTGGGEGIPGTAGEGGKLGKNRR